MISSLSSNSTSLLNLWTDIDELFPGGGYIAVASYACVIEAQAYHSVMDYFPNRNFSPWIMLRSFPKHHARFHQFHIFHLHDIFINQVSFRSLFCFIYFPALGSKSLVPAVISTFKQCLSNSINRLPVVPPDHWLHRCMDRG